MARSSNPPFAVARFGVVASRPAAPGTGRDELVSGDIGGVGDVRDCGDGGVASPQVSAGISETAVDAELVRRLN